MADINDYGKFETFYQPKPEEKEDQAEKVRYDIPRKPPTPFLLADFRGSNVYQKPA